MIFCVEDDESIRDLMLYTLTAAGFTAEGFSHSKPFWEAMRGRRPQLILLDIMLPGEDGVSILKKLRAHPATEEIPVIMATAKGTEYDRVIGLDLGADDYMSKPFGMMEMVSRVRAVLRRAGRGDSGEEAKGVLRLGGLELDPGACVVRVEGRRVDLTRKEYRLLLVFMENPGRVFTRDQLLELVWGMDYTGETRTVDVHIGTLRTKLDPCGNYIATVRGIGYRMEEEL
ncbi:response regulator transcription factor [Acutalibacter intestini]|uniref:response regulator transcription factor n=1 Tax=Acutalibacter intestini TaxID=3093659 RepID=UPI002AC8F0A1|nr:response regulator transcription factor [Acutalibacter sp. M00204]